MWGDLGALQLRRAEQFEFVKENLRGDNKESVTIIREQERKREFWFFKRKISSD